jgi:hypothetical protein
MYSLEYIYFDIVVPKALGITSCQLDPHVTNVLVDLAVEPDSCWMQPAHSHMNNR